MTETEIYLRAVINRHRASAHTRYPQIEKSLRAWAGQNLESIALSGSHAKRTALRDSDVDLFLSLSPATPSPLSEIKSSLANHFRHYLPQIRNISVRIHLEGASLDLIPARRRPDSTLHTLWQSRYDTWLQTDIAEQIRVIRSSGLLNEILALKIWRRHRSLRFPSFLLELSVLRALQPAARQLPHQILGVLEFLATDFPSARLIDPANSNNEVSAVLTPSEKQQIAAAARQTLESPTWPEIL